MLRNEARLHHKSHKSHILRDFCQRGLKAIVLLLSGSSIMGWLGQHVLVAFQLRIYSVTYSVVDSIVHSVVYSVSYA